MTPDGIPRLVRLRDAGIVGGVCAGVASHLRVSVVWVRVTFALLAVMGGAGVLAYALLWVFVPQGQGTPSPTTTVERRQAYGIAAVGVAMLIAGMALGFGDWSVMSSGPLGLAAIGGAFIWREADDSRRARWRRSAAGFVGFPPDEGAADGGKAERTPGHNPSQSPNPSASTYISASQRRPRPCRTPGGVSTVVVGLGACPDPAARTKEQRVGQEGARHGRP